MYNINIPGIPDLSNIDFSQFAVPQPTPVVPQQPVVAPAPVPAPVPAPAFDPYAGMTQADLAEIGMMLPPQPVPQPVAPAPAPVPAPMPAPAPQGAIPIDFSVENFTPDVAPTGIETMAPRFQMTEDFALPVGEPSIPVPAPAPAPAPAPQAVAPTPAPTPTPAFDPYVGMTRADLEEIGMAAPLSQTLPAPAPAPQPVAPSGVDFNPNSPAMNAETLGGTPDVSNVAQSLINTGPITLPNGETFDIRDLDLSGLDLTGLGGQGVSTQPAQGQTTAQTTRGGDDLSQIPGNYFTGASDYYTDGQLADMGIEPGTVVSTGANPQQPAGTQIEITPEQQAAIDNFLANNPAGSVVQTPFGNISLPQLSNYTQGNTSPNTNTRAAEFVVQNLTIQQDGTQGRGGQVATEFGFSRGAPAPAQGGNPFRRPTDGGIASLVPSGG